MKVNSVENSSIALKSRFVPNKLLEDSFNRAYDSSDRLFLQSVKAILNDGKNDVFELVKIQSRIDLKQNGKTIDDNKYFTNYYGDVGCELISKYVNKILGNYNIFCGKYQNLTADEKNIIREKVDVIKMYSEQLGSANDYIDYVQKELNNIKTIIDENARTELQKLKQNIFGRK